MWYCVVGVAGKDGWVVGQSVDVVVGIVGHAELVGMGSCAENEGGEF